MAKIPAWLKSAASTNLTYIGYNKKDAQLCLAVSRHLLHWERKGILLPAYKGNWNADGTKSGAILKEKINGKYWMYWLGSAADHTDQMGLSYSSDLIHWTEATETPVLPKRPGKLDSRVVEPGPPPVLMTDGIVLVYNGADDKLVCRSEAPLFAPELEWEKVGQLPNVVFVEGLVADKDRYLLYYGGADKYVGVAAADTLYAK